MNAEAIFKQNLYRLRSEHGYSKMAVANGIKIARSYYGYLEEPGKHVCPSFEVMDKIAEFYNITVDELFK